MAGTFGLAATGSVLAQNVEAPFPHRPVRMIIPLAPGGGSDIVGRMVAGGLSTYWQQTVVVDNRPGAGSTVGTSLAAKAPADGYTVMVSSSSMAISPALHKHLDFDMRRDFAPLSLLASQPSVLAVHPSVKVKTLAALIAMAKAQPGKLTFASAGPASATHLGTELLLHAAGVRMLHVPYKSAGQATTALLGGETQVLFTNMASLLPHIKSGKIGALGVSSAKRSQLAPDLPTLAEAGLPGFEYATWYGMVAPKGLPRTVLTRWSASISEVMHADPLPRQFAGKGLAIHASSPVEFARYLSSELDRWQRLVTAASITLK
jgi:tripartite-type tricarboxylate transporter receptor subunit TctC